MPERITLIFILSSICYGFAQEDRPLPALIESSKKKEAQLDEIASHGFHSRVTDPVTIDVRREINKVALVARNTSFYPYTITLHFKKIRNLLPAPDSVARFVILPGTKPFMNFKIFDPAQNFDFDFKVDKKIGGSVRKPALDFPYLLPIRKNKSVALPSTNLNDTRQDLQPIFFLNKGDTISAMRKGVVTAVPLTPEKIDRIVSNSIEVMHMDGTVMVYENIDLSKVFIRPGETVHPGQPLGTAGFSELLVSLFQMENEKLKNIEILFYVEEGTVVSFSKIENGTIVRHPLAIIEKEMNRRELRTIKR